MNLTGKFKVLAIVKKTSAEWFKNLKVGDEFELHYNINGLYHSAPSIAIVQNGKAVHYNLAGQLNKNLEKFEIVQVA